MRMVFIFCPAEPSKLQRSKHTVSILDEPATGLHLADVERLLGCLNQLVDAGHTVLVIRHHLDSHQDRWPRGGHAGSEVVVTDTPDDVPACKQLYRGDF